jgi:hypothetical protein
MAMREISIPLPYNKEGNIGHAFTDHAAERKKINQERDEGMKDLNAALNDGYTAIDIRTAHEHRIYLLHRPDSGPKAKKYIPHPDSPHS